MSVHGEITRENYFDFDALSQSGIAWALPEAGGSMDNFHYMQRAAALKEFTEEENSSMRIGTALHKYVENPGAFDKIVCPIPGPGMVKVIKNILTEPTITSLVDPVNKPVIVRLAREAGYGGTWGEDAILKRVIEDGSLYFAALRANAMNPDQMLVSPAEDEVIMNCINRIQHMPWLIDPDEFYGKDWEVMREVPIEFMCEGVKCKSLLDRLIVNHKSKEFCIEDLKTTATPIEQYLGYQMKEWDFSTSMIKEKEVPGKYLERGVHRQLAFYSLAVLSSGKFPGYTLNTASVLALQTVAPFSFRRHNVDNGHITAGMSTMLLAVKTIAKHGEDTVEL